MPSQKNVERLLSLALTLASTERGLSREELVTFVPGYEDFTEGSRRRQFARDLNRLTQLGYQLASEPDSLNPSIFRYRIVQDTSARIELADLDPETKAVLGAAGAMFSSDAASGIGRRVKTKLAAEGIAVHASHYSGRLGLTSALTPLIEAEASRRRVTFSYLSRNAISEERSFEPWRIFAARGREYAYGFDVDRKAPRVFRLDRFVSTPKDAGPARVQRAAVPPVDELLPSTRAELNAEVVTIDLEPYKALALRTTLGLDPQSPRWQGQVQNSAEVMAKALKEPLWVRIVGPSPLAEQWLSSFAQVASVHAGSPVDDAGEWISLSDRKARAVTSFDDDVVRLSALISYVYSHPDTELAQLAAHFGTDESALKEDLSTIFLAGDYSRGFDDLVEATWDDGFVSIRGADALAAPLCLTHSEVAALLLGIEVVECVEGARVFSDAALARARAVLTHGLPHTDGATRALTRATHVPLPAGQPLAKGESHNAQKSLISLLKEAALQKSTVRILHSPADRPGYTVRDVEVHTLESAHGFLYLTGLCHLSGKQRRFRSDRIIQGWLPTDSHAPEPGDYSSARSFTTRDGEKIVVEVSPRGTWILEAFAAQEVRVDPQSQRRRGTLRPTSVHALVAALFEAPGEAQVLSPLSLREEVHRLAVSRMSQAPHSEI